MTMRPQTTPISIHDLKEGDEIFHHCARLKVSDRQTHGLRPGHTEEEHGEIITFAVTLVGDDPGSIPMHWLDDSQPKSKYVLQGNRRCTVSKIVG